MKRKRKYKYRKLILFLVIILSIVCIVLICIQFANKKNVIKVKSEDNKNVELNIPNGFYYVGGTIDSGVVISDSIDDKNKGTDYSQIKELKGNQFVWVPIQNPVAKDDDEVNKMVLQKKYPIAQKNGENYKAVLYDWNYSKDKPFKVIKEDSNTYKEPFVLIGDTYGDKDDYISGSEQELYQSSFNEMVNSVIKNKGFYISRYEISNVLPALNGQIDKCNSKAGELDINNLSWIEEYNAIKNMYKDNNVKSDMIWGCLWDATMIWLYNSDPNLYFQQHTDDICNCTGKIMATASDEKYSFKNIFDLLGNVSEYTQEAMYKSIRITRGGAYDFHIESEGPQLTLREKVGIGYPYKNVGSRAVLYF